MRPIEVHHKADRAIGDLPSFVIVMDADPEKTFGDLPKVFGQISLAMLKEGLGDVGYKVVRV